MDEVKQIEIGKHYKVKKGLMAGYGGKVMSKKQTPSGVVYRVKLDAGLEVDIHEAQVGKDPLGTGFLAEE